MPNKRKILTVLGTRPHFIKAAPVAREIAGRKDITEIIVHTGQHYSHNMDAVFFQDLSLPTPDYHYEIQGDTHGTMVGHMVDNISQAILTERPDAVMVYGDTNTTLAGALAARIADIPVAHVEAGVRSFDRKMQEEVNRTLIDKISNLLFCPSQQAVANLAAEGLDDRSPCSILDVGDIMADSVRHFSGRAKRPTELPDTIAPPFLAATIHRAENTDNHGRLRGIFNALETVALTMPVILPLHPRTKKNLFEAKFPMEQSNITFIQPVGYLEMLWLLRGCSALITDGGGLQKEAYYMKRPCITIRDRTEWTELLDTGCNVLAGDALEDISKIVSTMINIPRDFSKPLYGDGKSARRIVDALARLCSATTGPFDQLSKIA